MKKRLIPAIILLVLIITVVLVYYLRQGKGNNALFLSGNVEVTEVNVGFTMPGRVSALFTDEGETVKNGQKIATLDDAETLSLVNQGKASVADAQVRAGQAKRDLDRISALYGKHAISSQQMDAARSASEAADAQLRLAKAALETAEVRLNDTVLLAPLDGVVLRKIVEAGETVAAGVPVFVIGDLADPWIKVYVREDELGRVKLGQRATVTIDTYPGRTYTGKVVSISSEAEFTPKNVQTQEERVKLVFGVKVKVQNENNDLKPGMPADVRIFVQ